MTEPPQAVAPPPGYVLPTARQVVGRGFQLAYDATRDLRRASLFIGLVLLAVAGPFVLLLLVDIPRLVDLPFDDLGSMSQTQSADLLDVVAPLYAAGIVAALGLFAVSLDAVLIAVGVLGGWAVGRRLTLREALVRARQAFWRYLFAALFVGTISVGVSAAIQEANGSFGHQASVGLSLLISFVSTIVVLPFSYIATAIVIGDVNGAAALGRSVTLVRARPQLAFVVAAFAFAASALQTFGIGAAVGLAGNVIDVLHLSLDMQGPGLVVALAIAALALVALGSLILTVAAITTAPQVAAFLGLTHYAAGLDRARSGAPAEAATSEPIPPTATVDPSILEEAPPPSHPGSGAGSDLASDAGQEAPVADPAASLEVASLPEPAAAPTIAGPPSTAQTYWDQQRPTSDVRTRWITIPMLLLIVLEVAIVLAGIAVSAPS